MNNRHRLLLRVTALVVLVVGAKLLVHGLRWEIISINPLFSGIVAANVFLMGFLLSGVLSDFKESERYPGELSACLENLAQEVRGISNIRVAIVDPGATRTAMRAKAYPGEDPASVKSPDVVAARIAALASEDFASPHRERVDNPA